MMKVKDVLKALKGLDPEMECYCADPDRSSIITDLNRPEVVEIVEEKQFAWSERHSADIPIGTKIVVF